MNVIAFMGSINPCSHTFVCWWDVSYHGKNDVFPPLDHRWIHNPSVVIHVAIMDFFGSTKSIQSDWYIQFGSCLNIETISGSSEIATSAPISQCCARRIKNSEFLPNKAGARKPSQAWAWIGSLCFRHGSPAISWPILRSFLEGHALGMMATCTFSWKKQHRCFDMWNRDQKTSSPPGSILGAPQCQHRVAGAWIVGGFSGFPSPSRAFPEMKSTWWLDDHPTVLGLDGFPTYPIDS